MTAVREAELYGVSMVWLIWLDAGSHLPCVASRVLGFDMMTDWLGCLVDD